MTMEGFRPVDACAGEEFAPAYRDATAQEVAQACAAAGDAFVGYGAAPDAERVALLRVVADVEGRANAVVELADRETGMGAARLVGELAQQQRAVPLPGGG